MTVGTSWRARSIAVVLALVAGATPVVASASEPTLFERQQALLDRGCHTAVATVQKGLTANTLVSTIRTRLDVVTRGALTGQIVFNPAGSSISMSGHIPPGTRIAFLCNGGSAALHGLGPGRSHVVATLRRSFARPGRHTLIFRLDVRGRRILARLAAADRAYRERHSDGHTPPEIAFGVALTYIPTA